ncbi:MAG TPA: hypothetical protein VLA56_19825 [Pseudomonadales bacterium]|nr:hypothetical protein [Pseudomonadales bacterium]
MDKLGPKLLLATALALAALGCRGQESPDAGAAPHPDRMDPELLELRQASGLKAMPERVPPEALIAPAPVTGEVPADVMETALRALETLTGASRDSFEVVRAESVVWPDGSLGCPQPGMVYTQATVPGHHIVLRHAGRDYDYRAGRSSYLLLCLAPDARGPVPREAPTS